MFARLYAGLCHGIDLLGAALPDELGSQIAGDDAAIAKILDGIFYTYLVANAYYTRVAHRHLVPVRQVFILLAADVAEDVPDAKSEYFLIQFRLMRKHKTLEMPG